jgi:hypothetical protein
MHSTINKYTINRFMKNLLFIAFALILLVPCANAQVKYPGYKQPWPKATPESQGFSKLALESARDKMRTDQDQEFQKINMIIIRNGHDIFHYGNPYELPKGANLQKDWASCGRSLMTTMYGMVFKENEMSVKELEKPAREVFHSYIARELDSTILAKHLLSYTACANPPGSSWSYACHYFTMYEILRDMDGYNPAKRIEKLAKAIDADWQPFEYWGHKVNVPFLSIIATEAEAARWGYLWMNKGNWSGNQVVDKEFVEYSLKPIDSPLGGYAHSNEGLQMHMNYSGMWGDIIPRDAFAAFGAGGKIIFVCPSLNLVIAATTSPTAYYRKMVGREMQMCVKHLFEPIIKSLL